MRSDCLSLYSCAKSNFNISNNDNEYIIMKY